MGVCSQRRRRETGQGFGRAAVDGRKDTSVSQPAVTAVRHIPLHLGTTAQHLPFFLYFLNKVV